MDEKQRYDEGMNVRRAVLGDAHVDRSLTTLTEFNSEFQEMITRHAWGDIWTRPGLPRHTRSLITIAMLIGMNREGELKLHLRAAANNGVSRGEIKEVIMQSAIYCGIPAANATFHDKDTNIVDNYQSLMFVYKGPFDARPKDDMGIGFARIHVNDDVKKNAELVNASNGVSDYNDPLFSPLRDTEYNYELNYGFHVTNWLTVRPNLQYITHPGGVDEVDDALVAGLKIQSVF